MFKHLCMFIVCGGVVHQCLVKVWCPKNYLEIMPLIYLFFASSLYIILRKPGKYYSYVVYVASGNALLTGIG